MVIGPRAGGVAVFGGEGRGCADQEAGPGGHWVRMRLGRPSVNIEGEVEDKGFALSDDVEKVIFRNVERDSPFLISRPSVVECIGFTNGSSSKVQMNWDCGSPSETVSRDVPFRAIFPDAFPGYHPSASSV